jgi:hypothetical protein
MHWLLQVRKALPMLEEEQVNLKQCAEFSDVLFTTLYITDLLPDLEAPLKRFEEHGLLLLKQIEWFGVDAGWHEWTSRILKDLPSDEREDAYPELLVLRRWIAGHRDFFADEDNLRHLRQSLGGRGMQWMFSVRENIIPLSDAEEEWGHSNLRGGGKAALPKWKMGRDWFTTRTAMRAVYGEPKGEVIMKTVVPMDGETYYKLREVLLALEKRGVHFGWHPDSDEAVFRGDVLWVTNEAFEAGDITSAQVELVYEVCKPEALR